MDDKKYEKLLEEHNKILEEIDKEKEIKIKSIQKKELSEKIKIEIEKKGFYIYKEKEKNYFNIFSFSLGIILYLLISHLAINIGFELSVKIFFGFIMSLFFISFINKNYKKNNENNETNIIFFVTIFLCIGSFIFYIIFSLIFEKIDFNYYIFILSSIISIIIVYFILKNEDLKNYKLITENGVISNNLYIMDINQEKKKKEIKNLKMNLIYLEKFSKIINEKRKNISKNLKSLNFHTIKKEIYLSEKYINKSLKIKEKIKDNLFANNYFPKEKFKNYLKENLVFPLKELKNILQNNLEKIENLQNKNLENPQIILANKRLEIQKNSLQKQILLLDEKIKKLEN